MTDEINAYWHPDGSGIDAVFAERDALRVEVNLLKSEIDQHRLNVAQMMAEMDRRPQQSEFFAAIRDDRWPFAPAVGYEASVDCLSVDGYRTIYRLFQDRRLFLAALQQIAAAGPMFSPDDWRWKVAQDAIKSAHVNETPKREHDREDVLTEAATVGDADVAEIFGAPV